jgi:hypothetical protein
MTPGRESRPAGNRTATTLGASEVGSSVLVTLDGLDADPGICLHGMTLGRKCRHCDRERRAATAAPDVRPEDRARRSDPETSRDAARRIPRGLSDVHDDILRLLADHGPLTDDRLLRLYVDGGGTRSPQRVTTARHELVQRARVRWTGGWGTTHRGSRARLWEAIP